MRKKLTTLAVLCGAAASAQAQSSVTVYGLLDATVTHARQGAGTTTPGGAIAVPTGSNKTNRIDSGVGPGSRLGFRGTEDLGSGLRASFVLEGGIGADTGTMQQGGLQFGRQAWVGLSSGAGSVSLGRQYSPIFLAVASSDLAGGAYWANPTAAVGLGVYESVAAGPGGGNFQSAARVDNSVLGSYKFGALTARMMVAAGNENPRGTGRLVNPGISYDAGPLRVEASYARLRQPAEMITAAASPEWQTLWAVGARYDFGAIRVSGGAFNMRAGRDAANLSPAFNASPFGYLWNESRSYWAVAAIPFGASVVTLSATRTDFTYPTGPKGRTMYYGAIYEHMMSKRTALYASYGLADNDSHAKSNLFGAVVQVAPNGYGAQHSALSVGLRHAF